MIRTLATATVLIAVFGGAAAAETAPHPYLKAEATISGPIVRVGDLVANAGIIANVAIFRSPDLGTTGAVPADAVVEAVRAHALVGLDTNGLSEVMVTRASREIPVADVEAVVARALSTRFNLGDVKDIAVNFERDPRAIQVEPDAKGELRIAGLNYDTRTGRFYAMIDVPTGQNGHGVLRLSGRATATSDVVVMAHSVERGALIKDSDIIVERQPRAAVGRDTMRRTDLAVGLAARTNLSAGQALRAADLMKPELVQRNETVTLVYQVPGITLTVRGKAAEGGAEGDVIAVLNEQSKRTVQGTVVGLGRVIVSTSSPRLAANLIPARQDDKRR